MWHRLFHRWFFCWELLDVKNPGWIITIRCTRCGEVEVLE